MDNLTHFSRQGLQMLGKLKFLTAKFIIHLLGVRFYYSESLLVEKDIKTFDVTTQHGYKILFKFYKLKSHYAQYFFHHLVKKDCVIYAVNANFEEGAPPVVRRYNTVRIFMRDPWEFVFDDDVVVNVLLNVYLDYLLYEMKHAEDSED